MDTLAIFAWLGPRKNACWGAPQTRRTSGHFGAVDKVASENQQWEFEQKKRRSLASFRVPYQPLQVQSGR